jgi:TetR/AcrR family transcriptional regulator, transcriptional repressor for nem operon
MPRVSKAQSQANHQAIEAAASRLFRERGLHGVTVADVMADAGLTHGGFYAHYPSKDALAATACESAFAVAAGKWQRRIDAAATPREARRVIAERYLGAANCDPSVASCPTATLAADVARAGAEHPIHAAYVEGVRKQIDTLAKLGASGDSARDRADACTRLATMMGALLLARACHGDPLADDIVAAARARLATDDAIRRPSRTSSTRRTKPKSGAR